MKVLEAKFVRGFIRMCNDGWEQGWHERNGGNLSYRIKEEEIESVKEELSFDGEWKEIGASVPKLAKEFFMVTGSGNIFVMLFLSYDVTVDTRIIFTQLAFGFNSFA